MVPPFLAYYGVMARNRTAVAESYNQIRLYRGYLRDQGTNNLWRHMALGDNQDTDHWSTGPPRPIPSLVWLVLTRVYTSSRQCLGGRRYDSRPWHY